MTQFTFKLPDLGEGTVEAEIVAWHVKPGDEVNEDQVVADVMTEKATVEIPAPVSGRVVSVTGDAGDIVPVGTELIVFETGSDTDNETDDASSDTIEESEASTNGADESEAASANGADDESEPEAESDPAPPEKVLTSPSIRRLARDAGIDLTQIQGTGPKGRIQRQDLEPFLSDETWKGKSPAAPDAIETSHSADADEAKDPAEPPALAGAEPTSESPDTTEPKETFELVDTAEKIDGIPSDIGGDAEVVKVIGVRRLIAKRMQASKREIPHFSYVEEVDITALETLRRHLNERYADRPRLTYLPFIAIGLIKTLQDFPQCNATYDAEVESLLKHRAIHLGIATQSPEGLKVPVVRHAEARELWDLAGEITRVSEAAKDGNISPTELSGSTITITSLGKLGGIVTTPVINSPEVGIIGINKAIERPVVLDGDIQVRLMMNLSSSFDHRFVDGYDAAALIQALKARLENPATLFLNAD